MRKWIFLLALTVALSLFGLLPAKSQDVAALLPCQTLLVSQRDGTVCIAAAEELIGTGRDWDEALQALLLLPDGLQVALLQFVEINHHITSCSGFFVH